MALSLSRKLLFSAVTTVVVLGAAELGLTTAGWPQPTGRFKHNEVYWVSDPSLQRSPLDHSEMGTTFPVTTDENGLRAPIHDVDKKPGVRRIMTLGCSTTFGWGVADDETYPAQLEHLALAAGRSNIEVINGGQPGYTSFQGLWLWDEVLRDYSPDVVLVGYVVQDARKAAYSDRSQAILQRDHRFLKDNLLHRSRIYLALRSLVGGVQVEAKEVGPNDAGGVYRVPPEDYVDHIRRFVAEIRGVGATPVLFGYPLERAGYTAQHRRILQAAGDELGVLVLDPQDQMEQATHGAELYFPRDRGHANAAGNAMIARWVYDFLEKNDALGPLP